MNEIQKHLIKLLGEIDSICRANEISYVLYGRTAKDACTAHDFVGDYVFAEVLMSAADIEKLTGLVEKMEGRGIESRWNNPAYPGGRSVRYVDETTTFLYGDSAHNYKKRGIYVTILCCRPIPASALRGRCANAIDRVVSYAHAETLGGLSRSKAAVVRAIRGFMKIAGRERVLGGLMKLQKKLVGDVGGKMGVIREFKSNLELSREMLELRRETEFGGALLFVPEDTDKYLRKVYGGSWATDDIPRKLTAPHLLVSSTSVSYKELERDGVIEAERETIVPIISRRSELTAEIKALRSRIEKYWDYLFLTHERFALHRRFTPVEDILLAAYERGDLDWLVVAMADYLKAIDTYTPLGHAVVVGERLDRLAAALLRYIGHNEIARGYERLLGSTWLSPITLPLPSDAREKALSALPHQIVAEPDGCVRSWVLGENGFEEFLTAAGRPLCCLLNGELMADNTAGSELREIYHRSNGVAFPIGYLSRLGKVFFTVSCGRGGVVTERNIPLRCRVEDTGEIPLYVEQAGVSKRVCCLDGSTRLPVARLTEDGRVFLTPNAGRSLAVVEQDGSITPLDYRAYTDEAAPAVSDALQSANLYRVVLRLWQEDELDRRFTLAGITELGDAVAMAHIDASGEVESVDPGRGGATELCLCQADGTVLSLGAIDADGRLVEKKGPFGLKLGNI